MSKALRKLKTAYARVQTMTARLCAAYCEPPYKCCEAGLCRDALALAADMNEIIPEGDGDPRFPLIVNGVGCTAAPHVRPLCSMFLCPEARAKLTRREAAALASANGEAIRWGRIANSRGEFPLWVYDFEREKGTA